MRSTGVDLLQFIDLFIGAIVYEYKAESGIVGLADYKPKTQLLHLLCLVEAKLGRERTSAAACRPRDQSELGAVRTLRPGPWCDSL